MVRFPVEPCHNRKVRCQKGLLWLPCQNKNDRMGFNREKENFSYVKLVLLCDTRGGVVTFIYKENDTW